jgi:hypothetical protein
MCFKGCKGDSTMMQPVPVPVSYYDLQTALLDTYHQQRESMLNLLEAARQLRKAVLRDLQNKSEAAVKEREEVHEKTLPWLKMICIALDRVALKRGYAGWDVEDDNVDELLPIVVDAKNDNVFTIPKGIRPEPRLTSGLENYLRKAS